MAEKKSVVAKVLRRTRTHLIVAISDTEGIVNNYHVSLVPDEGVPTYELVKETADEPEKHTYNVVFSLPTPSCQGCPGWLRHKPHPCKHISGMMQLYTEGQLYFAPVAKVNPFTKEVEMVELPLMSATEAYAMAGKESKIQMKLTDCLGTGIYTTDRTEKIVAILCNKEPDLWLLWADVTRQIAHHQRGGFPAFKERLSNIEWFKGVKPLDVD